MEVQRVIGVPCTGILASITDAARATMVIAGRPTLSSRIRADFKEALLPINRGVGTC
jgi:hypothetical protein